MQLGSPVQYFRGGGPGIRCPSRASGRLKQRSSSTRPSSAGCLGLSLARRRLAPIALPSAPWRRSSAGRGPRAPPQTPGAGLFAPPRWRPDQSHPGAALWAL